MNRKSGPNAHAIYTQAELAAILGMPIRTLQDNERRAVQKLKEALAGVADDYFSECRRNVCGGRWNGKKIVRVER